MRLVAVVLLAVLCWLLVPVPATAAAARHQVMIMNFTFSAPNLTVRVGDTITWTNHDDAPHDVVTSAGPAAIRSPLLQKGQSWSTTVTAAGNYALYCSVHPDMRAQVVVLAPEPANPPPQQQVTTTTAARAPAVRAPAPTTTTTAPATTSDVSAVPQQDQPAQPAQAVAAQAVVGERLDPMLIVAGIVAAVAVLCLLLLSARPDA